MLNIGEKCFYGEIDYLASQSYLTTHFYFQWT